MIDRRREGGKTYAERETDRQTDRQRKRVNKEHARSFTEKLKRLLSLALIDVQYLGKVGGANISPCS